MDVVIKTGNLTSCNARLKQLGLIVRDDTHEFPAQRIEDTYEVVNTPILEDINGDLYFTVRLNEGSVIPPSGNTPNFEVLWSSDEVDTEGNLLPWPEVEVQAYDIDGNPSGTRMQGVGRIV